MRKRELARRRRYRGRRIFGVIMLVLLTLGGVWGYRTLRAMSPTGNIFDPFAAITNPHGQFPNKDRILILVAGKDYNRDRKGIAYTKDARSDTIMLLAADLHTPKLTAVAIPRDTRVTAPDGITGKINGTFQRGGVNLLKETIASQFGVMPDYHVVLKADAVKTIVDAVGGVEVEAIDDMFYEDSWGGLKIDIPKGQHRLTGDQAVGFVRFRKMGTHRIGPNGEKIPIRHVSSLEEGDLRRTDRQQQLVRALTKEAMSPKNIVRAADILNAGFSQVETNLERKQLLALAKIFRNGGAAGMNGTNIPGKDAMIRGIYYYEPDLDRAKWTIDWLLQGDEMAGRRLVRVEVLNGSDRKGVARATADVLSAQGFEATSGGNIRDRLTQTEVVYRKATYEGFAREIAKQIGATSVRKDANDPRAEWLPEVTIRLGADNAGAKPAT